MNRILADAMGVANIVIAVVLPVGGLLGGALMADSMLLSATVGALVGFAAGALYAVLLCGMNAVVLSSYQTLKEIRDALAGRPPPPPPPPAVPDVEPGHRNEAPQFGADGASGPALRQTAPAGPTVPDDQLWNTPPPPAEPGSGQHVGGGG